MSNSSMPDGSDSFADNSQIEQNVRGDHSQVIGQVSNSPIINFAGESQVINISGSVDNTL